MQMSRLQSVIPEYFPAGHVGELMAIMTHPQMLALHRCVLGCGSSDAVRLAVGETVILLHPPLPQTGVSIGIERGCQQNDSLANG